jgi:hypothetical protein
MTNEDTFRSERRSTLKKRLTEPTLLEMSGYPTNQELAAGGLCYQETSPKNRSRNVALHSFLLRAKVLETEFQADVGLPLFGMVADRSREAAEKRVAENSARRCRARG